MTFISCEYHKKHRNEVVILSKTEVYIKSLVPKKKYISFDRRCGIEEDDSSNKIDELISKIIETSAEVKL